MAFQGKAHIESRYNDEVQGERQREPCVAPSTGRCGAATGVRGGREMVSVCPGKERAIHEGCKWGLALRGACRPGSGSGHVSP